MKTDNNSELLLPYLIDGGSSKDERGTLDYFNSFTFNDIKRFYTIQNKDSFTIRAWQGHRVEKKYFFVTSGSFIVCAVKVDNWSNPSPNLKVNSYILSEYKPQILIVPPGYANGIKALKEDSKILVFSNLKLDESKNDNYRFPEKMWYNWSVK